MSFKKGIAWFAFGAGGIPLAALAHEKLNLLYNAQPETAPALSLAYLHTMLITLGHIAAMILCVLLAITLVVTFFTVFDQPLLLESTMFPVGFFTTGLFANLYDSGGNGTGSSVFLGALVGYSALLLVFWALQNAGELRAALHDFRSKLEY